jgi:hypothetical protein
MNRYLIIIASSMICCISWGQVKPIEGGIFSQMYSKEITEYRAKEYIVNEILQVPNKNIIEFEIISLTASKSGELTTVIYDCKALKKRGLIFAFWNEQINDFNTPYKGYAFKNFNYGEAKQFLDSISIVLEQKKGILSLDNNENLSKNVAYKWDDLTFVFYKGDIGGNLIRVFWKGFDSEWNQLNLKTTKNRFDGFFHSNN